MEIILIVPLIVLGGAFAMAEIALVSVRKPRLQQWADQGNTSAQVALDLSNKPETFLATVQMGMTLIGIFAGAFGERTLSIHIESYLNQIPRLAALWTHDLLRDRRGWRHVVCRSSSESWYRSRLRCTVPSDLPAHSRSR